MSTNQNKIPTVGIIDSGIGGISVWARLVSIAPMLNTEYYADTANCPYGGRTDQEILELTKICVDKLLQNKDISIIILACNTITAVAVENLRDSYRHITFVGMEPAVKPAALASKSGTIGILATKATLRGRLYHDTSRRWASNTKLIEMAGEGLVEMVEQSMVDSKECDELVLKYITPMMEQDADHVVLGCTHYPFLSHSIERLSCGKLKVVEPSMAIAGRVIDIINNQFGCNILKKIVDEDNHHAEKIEITKPNIINQGISEGRYIFRSSIETPQEINRIEKIAMAYYVKML